MFDRLIDERSARVSPIISNRLGLSPQFYCRVTSLRPTYYDEDLGFALLGEDHARVMPWGQAVAYVQAPEGTILGFV